MLDAARRIDPEFYAAIRLSLVEQSPAARAAQTDTLGPHAALLTHSSAAVPDSVTGVIFANELLDALPVHVAVMTESGLREAFVDLRSAGAAGDPEFVERLERAVRATHCGIPRARRRGLCTWALARK